MEKITSTTQLMNKYGYIRPDRTSKAMDDLGVLPGHLNSENFWQVREQCRINDGTYTPIRIDGDDKMHFLHVSIDDPEKVSYTKDADKGRQDIQTRTTLAAYCEKFGLEMPEAVPVRGGMVDDSMQMAEAGPGKIIYTPQPKTSIREKLGMIQDLIDEVLADLG